MMQPRTIADGQRLEVAYDHVPIGDRRTLGRVRDHTLQRADLEDVIRHGMLRWVGHQKREILLSTAPFPESGRAATTSKRAQAVGGDKISICLSSMA